MTIHSKHNTLSVIHQLLSDNLSDNSFNRHNIWTDSSNVEQLSEIQCVDVANTSQSTKI